MDNNPSATIPGADDVAAAVGGENVSPETVSLHELVNKELNTNYKDDAAALQGLKETKAYVGRVGQVLPFLDKAQEKGIPTSKLFEAMDTIVNGAAPAAQPSVNPDQFATKEDLMKVQRDLFYKDNPDFATYRSAIDNIATATGKSPSEIVASEEYKGLFASAKGFEEVQKTKSVLQTNPRLGVASDNMTKAAEAIKAGDQATANDLAVKAVMEAFDIH